MTILELVLYILDYYIDNIDIITYNIYFYK
jgi:hypothetical protein